MILQRRIKYLWEKKKSMEVYTLTFPSQTLSLLLLSPIQDSDPTHQNKAGIF